ncbi:DMSO/selenate family reductase complex B subunit [Sutterella megalosphaeroides]|uniref:Dimethylsulfoxide reductase, chain B n=1 Tax=Sutterella megalosphaeroides TaxID=2494234 RepID=A0A2Z6IAI1_9BURK|nr:DMSO/selenate family reductase complex B subunit [Sutterella megalosphaeroides]BBF23505.1 dimethylsulfoxide reductase, chain B [Sutterella megalosphaeroides]
MKQYGFFIDAAKCTGCKTCVVACKDKHGSEPGIRLRRVTEYAGGTWKRTEEGAWKQDVFAYYVSDACNHCADPACVKVCPTKAHAKHLDKGGLVLIDESKCIGCGACATACPYHAPQLDRKARKMRKCDGCVDRLEKGLLPVCVEACPHRAIEFGDIEELRRKHGANAEIAPLPSASLTKPNLVVGLPRRNAKPAGDTSGNVY